MIKLIIGHYVRHKSKSSTPFYKERKNLQKGQLFLLYQLQIFLFFIKIALFFAKTLLLEDDSAVARDLDLDLAVLLDLEIGK